MISAPLDPDSATQLSPLPEDGSDVTSAPTPEIQKSPLPPRDQRPRDGLRRRTTGRSDHISCLILLWLNLILLFVSSHSVLLRDIVYVFTPTHTCPSS